MRSFPIFFVLFLVIPIIEIFFLIKVGQIFGILITIILVISTAVIGAALLKQQGLSTLARFQQNVSTGKLPAQEMVEGIMLAVGGALLMTPGFVTDAMGFLCLIPVSRKLIAKKIMKHSGQKFRAGVTSNFTSGGFGGGFNQSNHDVYEGEFTEVKEDPVVIEDKKS